MKHQPINGHGTPISRREARRQVFQSIVDVETRLAAERKAEADRLACPDCQELKHRIFNLRCAAIAGWVSWLLTFLLLGAGGCLDHTTAAILMMSRRAQHGECGPVVARVPASQPADKPEEFQGD